MLKVAVVENSWILGLELGLLGKKLSGADFSEDYWVTCVSCAADGEASVSHTAKSDWCSLSLSLEIMI